MSSVELPMKVSNSLAWSGILHCNLREHGKRGSPVPFIVKVFSPSNQIRDANHSIWNKHTNSSESVQ